jgi:hypothetical protein
LPLDEVINVLQKNEPDFQAVIRYSGDNQDSPSIKLHLKNVTVPQVVDVLSKKYGWGVEPVKAAGRPPIYVIAVRGQKSPEWSVSAYCLTPIIDQLEQRNMPNPNEGNAALGGGGGFPGAAQKADEMRKKYRSAALADVVATVDTAVKMASDGEAVMIQVHEPTEMLIMRTGPKQREAAERVLKALDPGNTVVKAESSSIPHRVDPWFSGGASGSSAGRGEPPIATQLEMEAQQMLEARRAQELSEKSQTEFLRKLYEKRQSELQQHTHPAPVTQPHGIPSAPSKN